MKVQWLKDRDRHICHAFELYNPNPKPGTSLCGVHYSYVSFFSLALVRRFHQSIRNCRKCLDIVRSKR